MSTDTIVMRNGVYPPFKYKGKEDAYNLEWRKKNVESRLYSTAKNRAKRKGLDFSITKEDIKIPSYCPVFGTPFTYGTGTTASLDRIDNTKGYTKDNIQVISDKANRVKNNCSPVELRKLAEWILKTYQV